MRVNVRKYRSLRERKSSSGVIYGMEWSKTRKRHFPNNSFLRDLYDKNMPTKAQGRNSIEAAEIECEVYISVHVNLRRTNIPDLLTTS